jgi:hypothetical protein
VKLDANGNLRIMVITRQGVTRHLSAQEVAALPPGHFWPETPEPPEDESVRDHPHNPFTNNR